MMMMMMREDTFFFLVPCGEARKMQDLDKSRESNLAKDN